MNMDCYGDDDFYRISVSLLKHSHYVFKAYNEVNKDADVHWTHDKSEWGKITQPKQEVGD
jgi:hypothetical protein